MVAIIVIVKWDLQTQYLEATLVEDATSSLAKFYTTSYWYMLEISLNSEYEKACFSSWSLHCGVESCVLLIREDDTGFDTTAVFW